MREGRMRRYPMRGEKTLVKAKPSVCVKQAEGFNRAESASTAPAGRACSPALRFGNQRVSSSSILSSQSPSNSSIAPLSQAAASLGLMGRRAVVAMPWRAAISSRWLSPNG